MIKHNLGQGRKVNTECTHILKKSVKSVQATRRTNNADFINQC